MSGAVSFCWIVGIPLVVALSVIYTFMRGRAEVQPPPAPEPERPPPVIGASDLLMAFPWPMIMHREFYRDEDGGLTVLEWFVIPRGTKVKTQDGRCVTMGEAMDAAISATTTPATSASLDDAAPPPDERARASDQGSTGA